MDYRLLHEPTPYEEEIIQLLGGEKHRELCRIIISNAQEYGFVRKQDLETHKGYTRYDITKSFNHLRDNDIIKEAYRSRYPKGTLKGYELRHVNKPCTLLFEGDTHYEVMAYMDRHFYQIGTGENKEDFVMPNVDHYKEKSQDTLVGIYD